MRRDSADRACLRNPVSCEYVDTLKPLRNPNRWGSYLHYPRNVINRPAEFKKSSSLLSIFPSTNDYKRNPFSRCRALRAGSRVRARPFREKTCRYIWRLIAFPTTSTRHWMVETMIRDIGATRRRMTPGVHAASSN
jgi:hypothetical protein